MARYPKDHKEETRRRVVEAASRAFRAGGLTEVSVPRLMGEVGLTHGGFYAHFESKDALIAEACRAGMLETVERMEEHATAAPEGQEIEAILAYYLSRAHRDVPEQGCVMAALGGQIARQSEDVREEVTEGIRDFIQMAARHLGDAEGAPYSDEALVLVSGMIGAVLLSRTVADAALSDRVLAAAREFYSRTVGPRSA